MVNTWSINVLYMGAGSILRDYAFLVITRSILLHLSRPFDMWAFFGKKEDDMAKVPIRNKECLLSFLDGHFQDTEASMNITRQVRELISNLRPH